MDFGGKSRVLRMGRRHMRPVTRVAPCLVQSWKGLYFDSLPWPVLQLAKQEGVKRV